MEALERGCVSGAGAPYGLGSALGAGGVSGFGSPSGFFSQSGSGEALAGPSNWKAAVKRQPAAAFRA
jgi:hypothetical protein